MRALCRAKGSGDHVGWRDASRGLPVHPLRRPYRRQDSLSSHFSARSPDETASHSYFRQRPVEAPTSATSIANTAC